jgi:hypothetical protein
MLLSILVKVVVYSPFANIWEHSFPEALVAEGLVERGASVLAIRCGTMLQPHCVAMSAAGVGADAPLAVRQKVCSACMKRAAIIDDTMPFSSLTLDDAIDADDRAAADAARAGVTIDDWMSYEYDGVPLGAYAAYEFLLDNKVVGTDIDPQIFDRYLDKLAQSVIVYRVGLRLLAEHRPDHVLVSNRLYSAHHAFCMAASTLGIPSYTLQGGGHVVRRLETMTMFRDSQSLDDVFKSPAWKQYQKTPIGAAEVELVREHISGLLEASSAFAYSSAFEASQPADLRARFGVTDDLPVLLVPMSSEDEINAARLAGVLPTETGAVSLFADQFEWIRYLFSYAESRPDLHVIVRLHPRLFPNKRESVMSPVVGRIMDLLERRPANVVLNLPSDDVSLYDLMQIVDVVLNFRSSAGIELAAFGIPVVVPANKDFFTYPSEVNAVGRTEEEYAARIGEALEAGWSLEQTRRALRWWAFQFTRVAVDLSGSVSARPIAIRPKKPGLRLWLWRRAVWIVLQYGPLVRERLALRSRTIAPVARDILFDVLENGRGSLSDSVAWPPVQSSEAAETRAIDDHFARLVASQWKDVTDTRSLAGRIRAHLAAR